MPAIDITQVVSPEIFAMAVEAATKDAPAFLAGGMTSNAGMVQVSGSFTGSANEIGTTVSVPYFNQIGTFRARTDGQAATAQVPAGGLLVKEQATVQASSLVFDLTSWAQNSVINQGTDMVYRNAVASVQAEVRRAMDIACIEAAVATNTNVATGSKNLVKDVYNLSTPRYLDTDLLVDARMLFEDLQDNFAAIVVHPLALKQLLKLRDTAGQPLLMSYNASGLPMIYGVPVITSGACKVASVAFPAATVTGTSPAITIGGTANRYVDLAIKVTTGGALGTGKVLISIDGGKTYSRAEITTVGSGAPHTILDPHNGESTGVTVYWASGTFVVNDTYVATPTASKIATSFVKKNAIGFWFNAAKLQDLQSVPQPEYDATRYALHLYYVAHRYNQLPGSRLPGVATIYHNG